MTEAADLVLTGGEVHTLAPDSAELRSADQLSGQRPREEAREKKPRDGGDTTHEAVAVRDGRIVRVSSAYEVGFLEGVDTRVIDLDGRVVIPGFVDAHTHMEQFGQYLVYADLSAADSIDDALDRLRVDADEGREWVLGVGYDETDWPGNRPLTREDLDRVSEDRPVVAMRVDLHTASLNSVALDRLRDRMPESDLRTEEGEPTGVAVEDAATVVRKEIAPDREESRKLVLAARDLAHERGVTGVHEMVRDSRAPRVYRDLDREGELGLRVRIDYWSDHVDAASEVGLRTNHGSDLVRVGGIKTFTDGSFGSHTAKLFDPYADLGDDSDDAEDSDVSPRGQWVVDPDDLRDVVERAHAEGFQVCAHAIGDEAIEVALSAYESVLEGGEWEESGSLEEPRHRIEHAELATDDHLERMADAGVVACMQPNFLQWADEDGLYDRRIGRERRRRTNRFRDVLDAGVPLAFGSDCMPLDPLLGVHHAVNAPVEAQRLSVTEALRAYTHGAAYAGFDEDRLGTVEVGKCADLTVLERSPWDHPGEIRDIDVAMTLVDGDVVYDGR